MLILLMETFFFFLISQGLSNKEIGEKLFIAEKTVKVYVSRSLQKLGVKDRTQAAVYLWKKRKSQKQ